MIKAVKHIVFLLFTVFLFEIYSSQAYATTLPPCPAGKATATEDCICVYEETKATCKRGQYCSHVSPPSESFDPPYAECFNVEEKGGGGYGFKRTEEETAANAEIDAKIRAELENSQCKVTDYYQDWQGSTNCMFCDVFAVFFNAATSVAGTANDSFSKSVIPLIAVGFALWLAFTVLAFISSIETKDGRDLIVAIINQSFVVVIAVLILSGNQGAKELYSWTLEPIVNTGMKIAMGTISDIADQYNETKDKNIDNNIVINSSGNTLCSHWAGLKDKDGSTTDDNNKIIKRQGGIPASIGINIVCTIDTLQQRIAKVTALGSSSLCWSWKEKWFIIPKWSYFITGILLWTASLLMMLVYPFLMLDTVIQLGIAGALLPIAIFLFCFKLTRGYCKKVWDAFLNAMFNFIFLSIIVLLLATALESVITDSISGGTEKAEAINKLFAGDGSSKDLLKHLGWAGVSSLKIIFVMLMTWAILPSVGDYASDFAGALAPGGIGSKVGGTLGSAAKNTIASTTKPLRMGMSKGAKAVGKEAWGHVSGAARGAARVVSQGIRSQYYKANASIRSSGSVKHNGDGTTTHTYKNIWGTTKSVTTGGKDGPRFEQHRKTLFTGRDKVTVETVNGKITQWHKNGALVKDKFEAKGRIGKALINSENGTINQEAMDEIIRQQGGDAAAIAAVIRGITNKQMDKLNSTWRKAREKITSRNVIPIMRGGKNVGYEVLETYANGSKRQYSVEFADNGRSMLKVQHINKSGRVMTLATDGVVNKKTVCKLDKDGKIKVKKSHSYIGLSKYYKKSSESEINKANSLFSNDELSMAYEKQKTWNSKKKANYNMHEFS